MYFEIFKVCREKRPVSRKLMIYKEYSEMAEITYETKRSLAKKIGNITDKKMLIDIIRIIKAMNPTVPITENDNGLFITFNKLTPQTYTNIENYLHKNLQKKETRTQPLTSYIPCASDEYSTTDSMMRLSNKEKALIKKQRYSEQCTDA